VLRFAGLRAALWTSRPLLGASYFPKAFAGLVAVICGDDRCCRSVPL